MVFIMVFVFLGNGSFDKLMAQGENEEVTIIAPYKPTISDAFKINFHPDILPEVIDMPPMQYSIKSKQFPITVKAEPVKATRKPIEPRLKLTKSLVKAGFGNYTTPYLEFFANSLQSDDHALGIYLKHISSAGNIKDYANSGYSNSEVNIYGKKFLKSNALKGGIYYKRNVVHYYGFKPDEFPDIDLSKDDIKQCYQTFGANLGWSSNNTSLKAMNQEMELNYYFFTDKYNATENNIHMNGSVTKKFNYSRRTEYKKAGFEIDLNYYTNKDSLHSHNSGILKFIPFLRTSLDQYKFYFGVNIAMQMDTITNFHLYPEVKAEVDVRENVLSVYAGISGNFEKNSYRAISKENPFVISSLLLDYSNYKFKFFAGIYGNLFQNTDYNFEVSNLTVDRMPFFVNDTSNGLYNMFTVVYDNTNLWYINAGLDYHKNNFLRLLLRGNYYVYSMDKEEKPWQKPNFKLSFGIEYTLKEKIIMRGDVFANSSMYAKTFNDTEIVAKKIDGWIDLNLGFEYRFTEKLSFFINLNNLLNNNYLKWYNYPVQKFNFLAGVTFAF